MDRPGECARIEWLTDRVFQRFTRGESHDTPLRNLDRRTRLRVASGARLALTGLERAEADERDRVAFLQRPGDAVDQRFNCGGGAGFRRTGIFRNLRNQCLLVHGDAPRDGAFIPQAAFFCEKYSSARCSVTSVVGAAEPNSMSGSSTCNSG